MQTCLICGAPLTQEEVEKTGQRPMCYYCLKERAEETKRVLGLDLQVGAPEEYGRDGITKRSSSQEKKEEIEAKFSSKEQREDEREAANIIRQKLNSNEIEIMLKSLSSGGSLDDPPTRLEVDINDDFYIHVGVPGPMSDANKKMLLKAMKKLLFDVVVLKLHGTMFYPYLQDPDELNNDKNPFDFFK